MKMLELLEELSSDKFNAVNDFIHSNIDHEQECTLSSGWEMLGSSYYKDSEKFKKMDNIQKNTYADNHAKTFAKDCLVMDCLDYFHEYSSYRLSGKLINKLNDYFEKKYLTNIF